MVSAALAPFPTKNTFLGRLANNIFLRTSNHLQAFNNSTEDLHWRGNCGKSLHRTILRVGINAMLMRSFITKAREESQVIS